MNTLNYKRFGLLYNILLIGVWVGLFSACSKNAYYEDTGTINPTYSGSSLDYLKAKGFQFDSLVKIIHLAGLDEVLEKGQVTFFAPADSAINFTISLLNSFLKDEGRDTVSDLKQIHPKTWRETLSMYIFDSVRKVKDYPQLDMEARTSFHGQAYNSFENARIMNIGAIYETAAGVKYAGYRHLVISYIPSYSAPLVNWYNNAVASSDIVTRNGVIHALQYSERKPPNDKPYYYTAWAPFGFNIYKFIQNAINNGISK